MSPDIGSPCGAFPARSEIGPYRVLVWSRAGLFGIVYRAGMDKRAGAIRFMSICVTIFTMLSLAACAVAAVIFFTKRARFGKWTKTTGLVLEHVLRKTGKPGKLDRKYAPRVSYEVAGGGTFEFISSLATNVPPAVGEQVGVIYDPQRPGRAILDQFTARHRNEFLLFVLGAVGAITFGAECFAQ